MLRRPNRYAMLLRVRKREEDARAAALAKVMGALRIAEARRAELVLTHDDAMARAAEAGLGTDVPLMDRFAQYERHLTQLIGRADVDIDRLQTDRAKRQTEFELSHRRRKMIDRLMERTAERWEQHVAREERKTIEDAAAMRYVFTRRGERD